MRCNSEAYELPAQLTMGEKKRIVKNIIEQLA